MSPFLNSPSALTIKINRDLSQSRIANWLNLEVWQEEVKAL